MWNKFFAQKYGGAFIYHLQLVQFDNGSSRILKSVSNLFQSLDIMNLVNFKCFKWKVNNGKSVMFWEDRWHEEGIMQIKFARLYRIFNFKLSSISEFLIEWRKGGRSNPGLWLRSISNRE